MIAGNAKPILNPRRLGHVNLFVSDLGKARCFYSGTCGFREIFEEPAITAAFMSNGNTHHDLGLIEVSRSDRMGRDGKVLIAAAQRGSRPSLNHLGFEMESERALVEAYEALVRLSVSVTRTVDHGLARSVYMPDPDGNMLEFYADVIDDWRAFWKQSVGKTVTGAWRPDIGDADDRPRYPKGFQPDFIHEAPIHARRITCATLATLHMPEMLAFYERTIGLSQRAGSDRHSIVLAGSTGEPALRLVVADDAHPPGLVDMGIELEDQNSLEQARKHMRSRGLPARREIEGGPHDVVLASDPDGFGVRFHAPM